MPSTKQKLLLVVAGCMASLALPPLHSIPLIAGLGYGGWVLLAETKPLAWQQRGWRGFAIGWLLGFGWFAASLYWLSNALITGGPQFYPLIPVAATIVPAGLAIFWGVGFGVASLILPYASRHSRLLILIICFMLVEWLRGTILTGFPWQTPGMLFAITPLGFGVASLVGVWGCGVLACLLAFLPVATRLSRPVAFGMAGVVVIALIAGAIAQNRPVYPTPASGMPIRMVQPSIPQQIKWQAGSVLAHLNRYIVASRTASQLASPPELIVWGETAYSGFFDQDIDALAMRLRGATGGRAWLVTGGLASSGATGTSAYNSGFLLTPEAELVGQYDKRYLVPWGEFAPGRQIFPPLVSYFAGPNDFAAGNQSVLFQVQRSTGQLVSLAPLICYEIIFPAATRRSTQHADVLVNLTNDAWFGNSLGPRQHLAMAQMRAAELGIPVIRAANTGISALIDPYGKAQVRVGYNTAGWGDGVVTGRVATLYRWVGDIGFFVMLLGLGVVACIKPHKTA